jgi:hypothetical protein
VREVLRRVAEAPEFQGELDAHKRGLLASAWSGDGDLSLMLGQNEDSLSASQKAVEQARLAGDLPVLAFALSVLGVAAGPTGQADLAYTSSEESVAIARLTGEK